MDYLALMGALASGIVALVFAARSPAAGWLTTAFAWCGGAYLSGAFIVLGSKTHALSPTVWTGNAQIGPVTFLILLMALSAPFVVDWDRDGRRN